MAKSAAPVILTHIKLRKVSDLLPDPKNARVHSRENIEAIKLSYQTFGQTKPIVLAKDNKTVVAGSGQLEAAKQLGWPEVATVRVDHLTEEQAKAYALADNRTAELATWDKDVLVGSLSGFSDDLRMAAGFTEKDLKQLMVDTAPATTEEEVPEKPEDPVSRAGDIWSMGEHRLLCGDSTKAADLDKLMGGVRADLCLTDPPYGVDYKGKTEQSLEIANDGLQGLEKLLVGSIPNALRLCRKGAACYVAAPAGPQFEVFARVLRKAGVWRQTLVWVKDSMVLGHSDYHYRHEVIFYGWLPGGKRIPPPDRVQTTVLEYPRPKASREHPTMKPIELWCRFVANSSGIGDVVLDPFCGSGTSLVACERLKRRCMAVELMPGYADVCIRRWQTFSNGTAYLNGKSFAEVSAARIKKVPPRRARAGTVSFG